MKDLLIIAHFTQMPDELGNSRFHYIAEKIDKEDTNVEVVTTSFSHSNKSQRYMTKKQKKASRYKFTMLYEPGYKKNVTLRRFFSHYILGRNLKKYLENREKPDIIYCAVPSLDVALVAAQYAENNDIKFIIDIQDLWPEAFKMIFNIPVISNMIYYPMNKKADYIYKSADKIVSVSETYKNRALEVNKKDKDGKVVFLGTDLSKFDKAFFNNKYQEKLDNEIWIVYIGTLGHSYDLISVFDAIKILQDKGVNNLKFIVMGDGPLKEKFENYSKDKSINTAFIGRLSYPEMVGILGVCNIAVNPISKGAAASIINKHGDYAAAGLPVLNTQECPEYKNLVDDYKMGLNCINNDPEDMAEKLMTLLNDKDLRKEMGKNSRKLAEERFDREKTYKEIIDLLI